MIKVKDLSLGDAPGVVGNTHKKEPGKWVDLSFKVTPEFRREFRQEALDNDMSHKLLLETMIEYWNLRAT